jgi:hypothetical protein
MCEHCKECGTIYGEKCQCVTEAGSAEVTGYDAELDACPDCIGGWCENDDIKDDPTKCPHCITMSDITEGCACEKAL